MAYWKNWVLFQCPGDCLRCARLDFRQTRVTVWVTLNAICVLRCIGSYGLDNQISVPRAAAKMKNYRARGHQRRERRTPSHRLRMQLFLSPFWRNRTPRQHNIGFHLFRKVNINLPSSSVHLFSGNATRSGWTPKTSWKFYTQHFHSIFPRKTLLGTIIKQINRSWDTKNQLIF